MSLIDAVRAGNIEEAQRLLDGGAEIDLHISRNNLFPLLIAVMKNDIAMVTLLLNRGANHPKRINDYDDYGTTPLIRAVQEYNVDIVKILLENGADVNQANSYGFTPLDWASRPGGDPAVKKEIADLLVERGAVKKSGGRRTKRSRRRHRKTRRSYR